ncbi:hypothetical protein ACFGVR_08725 [Mucilaginibacter sp. AW1-3]
MARTYKQFVIVSAGLYSKCSLAFFLLMMLVACKHPAGKIALVWTNNRATAIQIPGYLIRDVSALRVKHSVKITLTGNNKAILGDFTQDGDIVVFTPLIPLSPGLSYDILQDGKLLGNVQIPIDQSAPPQLTAIYPETDTLPENTLKLYLRFSKPMRTGLSLNYVCLLDKNRDTMHNVFLNLQPELWDTSGTVLTLWLDPGRIKRGLVLNRELGNPLKKSEGYRLIISQQWNDTRGINLAKTYTKQFVAGNRDEQLPDINAWQVSAPKAGTAEPLIINTGESLDHYLLQECIGVLDENGKMLYGTIALSDHDQTWKFTPLANWEPKHYKLRVQARLEDLAGNNLNRVFDRDITKDRQTNREYFEREVTPLPPKGGVK